MAGACAASAPATQQVRLTGRVITWDGQPVVGAAIRYEVAKVNLTAELLRTPHAVSDADGRFSLMVKPPEPKADQRPELFVAQKGMAAVRRNIVWSSRAAATAASDEDSQNNENAWYAAMDVQPWIAPEAARKPFEYAEETKVGNLVITTGNRLFGRVRDVAGKPLAKVRVVATDMYEGSWQGERAKEGDPTVLVNPDQYAPFPYRKERLTFMKMDGRYLKFPDGTFDVAYSLSSIEHFGGHAGAVQTMKEMARVVRPGGVVVIATEYVVSGPPCEETFQPDEIHGLVRESGLELVEPIDELVYRRYQTRPVRLDGDPYQSPHMLVQLGDTVFTSVMLFLRKPQSASPA